MVVPGCPECAFSNDGFYYTPNDNITRGVAGVNGCECARGDKKCHVLSWTTMYDGTKLSREAKWTCFQSFGSGGDYPVVRCTWKGKHFMPLHGPIETATVKEKKQFFPNVAWEFLSRFHIRKGSPKEAALLRRVPLPLLAVGSKVS